MGYSGALPRRLARRRLPRACDRDPDRGRARATRWSPERTKNLEQSLKSDLASARGRADDLQGQLNRQNEFEQQVFPALAGRAAARRPHRGRGPRGAARRHQGRLEEVVGPDSPTGAALAEVAVVREPPDLSAIAAAAPKGSEGSKVARDRTALTAVAKRMGRSAGLRRADLQALSRRAARPGQRAAGRHRRRDRGSPAAHGPGLSIRPRRRPRLESGIMAGLKDTQAPVVGVERTDTQPSSISFFTSNGADATVDSVDLIAGRVATRLRPDRSRGQLRGQGHGRPAAARPAPSAGRRPSPPAPRREAGRASRSPSRSPPYSPGPWLARHAPAPASPGRTTGAGGSPSRRARCWSPARSSRWRRWRSSTTAPTSTCSIPACGAGPSTCSASHSSASSTTRSAGARTTGRRAAGAATRGPSHRGRFSTGAIKAVGALALAAYATSGLGQRDFALRRRPGAAAPRRPTSSTCSTCGPGGSRRRFVAARSPALCLGAWTSAPHRAARASSSARCWSAPAFTLRERAMLGDTGSNLVGALAGVSLLTTSGRRRRGWSPSAIVVALTIYGEFRSISRTIEAVPLLRSLDSLGRVD